MARATLRRAAHRLGLVCLVGLIQACGQQTTVEPDLSVFARPNRIDNQGQETTISIETTDNLGKPGTGTVLIQSEAGSLIDGDSVSLSEGKGTITFSCNVATDATCTGRTVKLTAQWKTGGKTVETVISVTVQQPTPDAGTIIVLDGGVIGEYTVTATASKAVLLQGTGDSLVVSARVTRTSSGAPVSGGTVTFTAQGGASFATAVATPTTTAMTDANGIAMATLYVATATSMVSLEAKAFDAKTAIGIPTVNVASIVFVDSATTLKTLAIKANGENYTTSMTFKVTNTNSMPVPGIDVIFEILPGSAAGCTITPMGRTDLLGQVQATLVSGDEPGQVQLRATVTSASLTAVAAFTIVIGRPSDKQLDLQCANNTLAALESNTPPRNDLFTTCTASVIDRGGQRLPSSVNVIWLSEAGSVDYQTATAVATGQTTNTFRTAGSLPGDVAPFPGEPTNGTKNPRDMFVTIVAATRGEEVFADGTGGGLMNKKWEPGEWFVDLPEPFVDSNDNQTWDPGEVFLDTERTDCTPNAVPTKNGRWDGPNGCWDGDTTIWRSAHVVYTDGVVNQPVYPMIEFNPPAAMAPGQVANIGFRWYDAYFNRLASAGGTAGVGATILAGGRGAISVTAATGINAESFGHALEYVTIRGRTEADGGTTELGLCDNSGVPGANERCFRRYRFTQWKTTPLAGTVTITAPAAQAGLADGGAPADTITTFQLSAGNALQTPALKNFNVSFQ